MTSWRLHGRQPALPAPVRSRFPAWPSHPHAAEEPPSGSLGEGSDGVASWTAGIRTWAVLTALPIFTHNAYGTGPSVKLDAGLAQLDVLESVGVKPQNVVIGHTCCLDDPTAGVIKQIASAPRALPLVFPLRNPSERRT